MPRDNRVLETTKVGQNGHESVPRVPLRTGAEGESETAHSENGSSSATVSGASPKYIKRQASATPFPVDAMPKSTRALIRESSVALKAPVDLIAIPMLAVISAAIGNTRKVQMKPRFQQPAGLFLCVVAPPGGNKSPSADVAMRVVDKLQNTYDAEYQKAMRSYEEELREHDAEKARKRAEKETPPAPPTEPRLKEMVVNDTTMEGLAGVLVTNPRGVLNHQDEMSGWVKAMDQYKSGGKGNERSHWLKFYDGRDDRFTRKSAPTLIVRRPFVTVMGGIQPLLMEELSGGVPDGLMDRIMFAYPEPRPGYLGDEVASRAAEIAYENLFSDLMTLKPGQDEDHRDEPITLKLTADAWEVYKGIDQNFQDEAQEPTFDRRLAAQWAKSRGQLGRLALILAVCRFAEEKTPKDDQHVAVQDVMRAGQLLRYFKEHAKRVYEVQETVNVSQLVSSGLVAFMEQEGTTDRKISATDLQRELDEATLALLPADPGQFAKAVHQATEGDPRISSKPGRTHDGKAIHLQLLVANKPPDSDG